MIMNILYVITFAALVLVTSISNSNAEMPKDALATPQVTYDKKQLRSLLRNYVLEAYKDSKGVHIESVLSALGSLSGFAVQEGLRQKLVIESGQPESKIFFIVKTKNNEVFYFGPIFDQFLTGIKQGNFSVWTIVAEGAVKAGATKLPDINLIAKENAERIGLASYGVPDAISGHPVKDLPLVALQKHWIKVREILEFNKVEPIYWGWEIAYVAQGLILEGKDIIPPHIAAEIVMEAAIPMSKIDPKRIL